MAKIKYVLILVLTVLFCQFIVACGSSKTQLSTPSFVNMISEVDNQMLVTEKNPYASAYVFGICVDESLKDDISKYVRYKSDYNYLDVSNIFTSNKNYYYYVQAIGNEKYKSSAYSKVQCFNNELKLTTPTLVCNNYQLSWSTQQYAQSYDVFINTGSGFEKVANLTSAVLDLSSFMNGSFLTTTSKIEVYVQAIPDLLSSSKFVASSPSNTVVITKHLTPNAPEISVNNSILTWNKVKNAVNYQVEIVSSEKKIFNVSSLQNVISIDLTQVYNEETNSIINYIEGLGEYSIRVVAVGEFDNSEPSNELSLVIKKQLPAPIINNATYSTTNKNIKISLTITDPDIKSINLTIKLSNNQILTCEDIVIENHLSFDVIRTFQELNITEQTNLTNAVVSVYSNSQGLYYTQSVMVNFIIE